jgi:hypothetical protein
MLEGQSIRGGSVDHGTQDAVKQRNPDLRAQSLRHHFGDQSSLFTAAQQFFRPPAAPRLLDFLLVRFDL